KFCLCNYGIPHAGRNTLRTHASSTCCSCSMPPMQFRGFVGSKLNYGRPSLLHARVHVIDRVVERAGDPAEVGAAEVADRAVAVAEAALRAVERVLVGAGGVAQAALAVVGRLRAGVAAAAGGDRAVVEARRVEAGEAG